MTPLCAVLVLSILSVSCAVSNYDQLFNQTLLDRYDQCYADLNENFIVYFTLRQTDVDFAFSGATSGWVGFGLGNKETGLKDIKGDPIVGYVASDGRVVVTDYYIESQKACDEGNKTGTCPDTVFGGTDDVSNINGWESNGFTTLLFTRPLAATNELYDIAIPNNSTTGFFMVAFGNSDDISKGHAPNAQFEYRMNVYDPDSVGPHVRCANNCGGTRGKCVKGCCVCEKGYGGVQCSTPTGGSSSDKYVDDGTSGGPSKGKIAGIIIGTLLAATVVVVFVAWIRRKQMKRMKKQRGIRLP